MGQLALIFNQGVVNQLKKVADCKVVDGVVIDEAELASLEEMIQEASQKEQDEIKNNAAKPPFGIR